MPLPSSLISANYQTESTNYQTGSARERVGRIGGSCESWRGVMACRDGTRQGTNDTGGITQDGVSRVRGYPPSHWATHYPKKAFLCITRFFLRKSSPGHCPGDAPPSIPMIKCEVEEELPRASLLGCSPQCTTSILSSSNRRNGKLKGNMFVTSHQVQQKKQATYLKYLCMSSGKL